MRYLLTSLLCVLTLSLTAQETGCTYPQADNYSSTATVDDGTCVFGSGLCGEGTMWNEDTQTCIITRPSDSNFDGCTGTNDLLILLADFGDCGMTYVFECGENLIYSGDVYRTVQIGGQCWFADNLNTEFYSNADPIDKDLDNTEWISTDQGAVASFGVGEEYKGMLYNWYAIDDDRNICPNGWRVSSYDDWIEMELFIGNPEVQGIQLKSDPNDVHPWNGTNARNFNGVPCGYRGGGSGTLNVEDYAERFWTVSPYVKGCELHSTNDDVGYTSYSITVQTPKKHGFSIRCVKD